jgi:hypothetical protein
LKLAPRYPVLSLHPAVRQSLMEIPFDFDSATIPISWNALFTDVNRL